MSGRRTLRIAASLLTATVALLAITGLVALPSTPEITIAPELRADPAVRLAAADLRAAFAASGVARLRWVSAGLPGYGPAAPLGYSSSSEPQALDPEGYEIRPAPGGPAPGIVINGGGPLGVAYGLMALAADVRLEQPYLSYPVPRRATPDFTLRLVSDPLDPRYPGPEQALRWGYNAVMTEPWTALALYESYDPAIYDPSRFAAARAWVEGKRREARLEIQQAKALHLRVIAPGDVILFPAQVAALYGRSITDAAGRYCIESPKVQALLAAALDELFTTFPEVDGIMVRTGENYPLGPLAGNTPAAGVCPRQSGDSITTTLQFLQAEVEGKHGRQLIYRGWDLGETGLHAQGAAGQRLAAALPTTRNTVLSYKITETDFWRYNRLNPNLLQGPFPRMVELQAAREYEGKGAFPNFVPLLHAQGLPESVGDPGLPGAHAAGVRQAWVWAKGGGWDGPFLNNPLWVEANAAGLGRLLWDVNADPAQLAQEWAAAKFGRRAAPGITAMLMRSTEAALKGFYLGCYALTHGPWTPNTLWVRDDAVTGAAKLRELYDGCGGPAGIAGAVAEKGAAVTSVIAMQDALRTALPAIADKQLAATLSASLQYERSLFEALGRYMAGMFYFFQFSDSGRADAAARLQALATLEQAQQAWEAHQATGNLPGAPTPFRDAGMSEAIGKALDDLRRP